MLGLSIFAVAALIAHAPTADYLPANGAVTICEEPQLLIQVRMAETVHASDALGEDARRKARCSLVFEDQRISVDFIEQVPWKIGPTTGVAKVLRGRMPMGIGVDVYFYGMAADFKYVGPPKP